MTATAYPCCQRLAPSSMPFVTTGPATGWWSSALPHFGTWRPWRYWRYIVCRRCDVCLAQRCTGDQNSALATNERQQRSRDTLFHSTCAGNRPVSVGDGSRRPRGSAAPPRPRRRCGECRWLFRRPGSLPSRPGHSTDGHARSRRGAVCRHHRSERRRSGVRLPTFSCGATRGPGGGADLPAHHAPGPCGHCCTVRSFVGALCVIPCVRAHHPSGCSAPFGKARLKFVEACVCAEAFNSVGGLRAFSAHCVPS